LSVAEHGPLAGLTRAARATGKIALDTEFMGEGRYQTLLCLVQLAVPESEAGQKRIEIVDPLAGPLDASLAAVLADPAVQVIVHAGRQDIALLRRSLGTEVKNVFDTQVAAGFVGMGAQSSYDSLLTEMLGVRLAKSASFTRWDTRPLSEEQLEYAREDVVHLLELAEELQRRLIALGRLQWASEECEPLEKSSDERDPETVLARLPRIAGLGASARQIARELVEWRERTAADQNRPVQSILSDAALIEIARRKPSSRSELESIRGLGAGGARRRAPELLDAVGRGRRRPPDTPPQLVRPPASKPEDGPLVALAEALLRARALEAGLAYELLATRGELQAVVAARRVGLSAGEKKRAHGNARVLHGWRRELVGEELGELLDGRLSLSVEELRVQVASRCGYRLQTAEGTSRSR
jgi:ribonuclease D